MPLHPKVFRRETCGCRVVGLENLMTSTSWQCLQTTEYQWYWENSVSSNTQMNWMARQVPRSGNSGFELAVPNMVLIICISVDDDIARRGCLGHFEELNKSCCVSLSLWMSWMRHWQCPVKPFPFKLQDCTPWEHQASYGTGQETRRNSSREWAGNRNQGF